MKIAVCDDEEFFRMSLISCLENYSQDHSETFSITQFSNGSELLDSSDTFDLIFLDYFMGKLNGIDTIKRLRERNVTSKVIFVSSFPDIVFESMKYSTYRFLIKPVDSIKLTEALDSLLYSEIHSKRIMVKDIEDDRFVALSEDDIIYVQADNVYCLVSTFEKTYRYMKSMTKLQREIDTSVFFKSNRSYMVNLNYVSSFTSNEITLCNGQKALLSKMKYKSFKETFFNFVKNSAIVQ